MEIEYSHGGSDGKESACSAGDLGSIPGSGRSPGERQWLPTPVFLPGEFHGKRSLMGYSASGRKVTCHSTSVSPSVKWGDRIERDVELETREGGLRRKAL